MKTGILLPFLLAAVLAAACTYKFDNPAELLPDGTIDGEIWIEEETGAGEALKQALKKEEGKTGVAGALVQVEGTTVSAFTAASGKFRIGGLPPGKYALLCSYDGDDDGEADYV